MGGAERAPSDRPAESKSSVARTTGHDRKTIGSYAATADPELPRVRLGCAHGGSSRELSSGVSAAGNASTSARRASSSSQAMARNEERLSASSTRAAPKSDVTRSQRSFIPPASPVARRAPSPNPDPRISGSIRGRWPPPVRSALQQRFDLLMQIHDALNQLDTNLNQAIDARDALQKAIADGTMTGDQAKKALDDLNRDIDDLVDLKIQSGEGALVYPGRLRSWLTSIATQVGLAFVPPTPAMVQVADGYIQDADAGVSRLKADIAAAHVPITD